MHDFHGTFGVLLHAANLRHGTDGFTSPTNEGVLRIFSPLKIRRLWPRTWVLKASTLPPDHRSRNSYLTQLDGGERFDSHSARFTPFEIFSSNHWMRGWMAPETFRTHSRRNNSIFFNGTRTKVVRKSNPYISHFFLLLNDISALNYHNTQS
jgi:hypothetical protein